MWVAHLRATKSQNVLIPSNNLSNLTFNLIFLGALKLMEFRFESCTNKTCRDRLPDVPATSDTLSRSHQM